MTPAQAALNLIGMGCSPIPIPHASKAPNIKNWQHGCIKNENDVYDHFDGLAKQNIGILLGAKSGNLVDIDLDCNEAIIAANILLQETRTFGRVSAPKSHYLYTCNGIKTKKYLANKITLVEIRSDGCQTVVPPSTHTSREAITYTENTQDIPTIIEPTQLLSDVSCVAAAALLARCWQQCKGSRHELAMAITGGLCSAGWPKGLIAKFMSAVIEACVDEEPIDRSQAILDTLEKFNSNANTTGWPTVAKIIGSEVTSKVREWLAIEDLPNKTQSPNSANNVDASATILIAQTLDTIKEERITFTIEDTLVEGKLNLFAGDAGCGKSLCVGSLLSNITTGKPFIVGNRKCTRGDILIFSAEDDPADMLKPRFRVAGADITKIHIASAVESLDTKGCKVIDTFRLDKYVALIEDYCKQFPIKAVLFDPTASYLGSVDNHKNIEVRSTLEPIIRIAAKYKFAIVAIEHVNKDTGKKALHRVAGSIAFGALARIVYFVGIDPDDEERRILAMEKANVMKRQPSLAFSIEDVEGVPKVVWEPEPCDDINAYDLLSNPEKEKTKRDHCKEWLAAYLSNGARPVAQLFIDADNAGYSSPATLKRAKKELGAKSEKIGNNWIWSLKEDQQDQGDQDYLQGSSDPLKENQISGSSQPEETLDTVDTLDSLAIKTVKI